MIGLGIVALVAPAQQQGGRRWTDRLWGRRRTDCLQGHGRNNQQFQPSPQQPTQEVVVPQPTSPPPQETPAPPPQLEEWPELTVLGTLESGIPHGVTADGLYFKGDPDATVMIMEFSEYQ